MHYTIVHSKTTTGNNTSQVMIKYSTLEYLVNFWFYCWQSEGKSIRFALLQKLLPSWIFQQNLKNWNEPIIWRNGWTWRNTCRKKAKMPKTLFLSGNGSVRFSLYQNQNWQKIWIIESTHNLFIQTMKYITSCFCCAMREITILKMQKKCRTCECIVNISVMITKIYTLSFMKWEKKHFF